jgi:hypothetical protein
MVALRWMRSGLVVTILALLITAQVSIADEEKDYEGDPDMDMDTPDTVAETQETPDDETTDDPNDNEDMYTNTDGAVKELMWDDWIETVVEEEELPWLVNFYATWCTPLRVASTIALFALLTCFWSLYLVCHRICGASVTAACHL